ncbi:hypothetical protein ACFT2C_12045 [Promicromonospora sp. NPDC057138]|uniref:hypothetical protein n=1 Tax=Promicromonospora sp. NPDC057138 TaxID=3346031 RepID=UPI003637B9DC
MTISSSIWLDPDLAKDVARAIRNHLTAADRAASSAERACLIEQAARLWSR